MLDLVPHVNARELAAMLGITTQSVWGLVRRGAILPPIRMSARKHVWCLATAEGIVHARKEPQLPQDTTHRRRRGMQLTVWVPPELKQALQKVAKTNGTTLTAAVCAAIQSWWSVCGSQTTPPVCLGKDDGSKS
jgi:predicted DNA-binding transcriptional regulator AlpA